LRFDPDLFGGAAAFVPRPLPERELVVVGFAGGGGSCTGIAAALGRAPDIAINHDAWALAVHAANHPATLHLSKNIWQVDPHEAVRNRSVGLAWFSPDCKHFSKAKGGRPVKRSIRDLAWVVVLWAKRARPRVIMLENVEEFRDWGPVSADGQPDKARKGETFARWVGELQRLGYRVEWRELVACDYGAPTTRKRLYLIARRDGRPIVWPAPTHGRSTDPEVIARRKRPWRTAAEIIDWSLPCPSIFATSGEIKRDLGIRANRPLAEATMARIAKGVWRYVLTAARPFIVPVTHAGDVRVHGIGEPVRTVTSAHRGELAVVAPFTACGQQGGCSRAADAPHRTITASPKDTNAVVAPIIVRTDQTSNVPTRRGVHTADEPARTIATAGGLAVVAPYLKWSDRLHDDEGHPVTDDDAEHGSDVEVEHGFTSERQDLQGDERVAGRDEGHSQVERVHATSSCRFQENVGRVAAFLAQHNTDMVGHQAEAPLSTIVGKGCTQGLVAAHLQRQFGASVGAPCDEPAPTITAGGAGKTAIAAAHIVNLHGADRRDRAADEPCPTVSAGGNHVAEVRAFLMRYYGEGGQWSDCRAPSPTDTTKARMGIVTVAGCDWQIVDIGMRMLSPRERFDAQGFPPDYIIDAELGGRRITGESQGRLVGNSVCPPVAEALVAANCADMAAEATT
jgi:DNA (cytosine-5)-methyltransferase 1